MRYCSRCNSFSPLSEFAVKKRESFSYSGVCKACHRVYCRERYRNGDDRGNAQRFARRKTTIAAYQQCILTYLQEHPCVDCGESDPRCLEFDHVRGTKIASISDLVRRAAGWRRLLDEIDKCEVRCANCHRRRTFESYNYRRPAC